MNDPVATLAERWLPVIGYEGLYEVSDRGRVRSVTRTVSRPGAVSGGAKQTRQGALLTPIRQNKQGHQQVRLCKNGTATGLSIHCLVLEAFVGRRLDGQHGLHANDIPTDNRLENLRWGTPSDNGLDCVRNGNHPNARKTRCPRNHEYSIRPASGQRYCKTCTNQARRNRYRETAK